MFLFRNVFFFPSMGLCSANFNGNVLCEGFYSFGLWSTSIENCFGLQLSDQVQPVRSSICDTFVIQKSKNHFCRWNLKGVTFRNSSCFCLQTLVRPAGLGRHGSWSSRRRCDPTRTAGDVAVAAFGNGWAIPAIPPKMNLLKKSAVLSVPQIFWTNSYMKNMYIYCI